MIPARLASSRLPRKPLHRLAGRPLVEWVWRRVSELELFEKLVVATESEEVAEVVRGFGGEVELTSRAHPSGTDRVAEVANRFPYQGYPLIVNVQGDEPFVRARDLELAARLVVEQGWDVGTVAAPLTSADELRDPAVVKVVRGATGGALYFSRAPIPFPRDAEAGDRLPSGPFLRHLGIYAYHRDALLKWVALPESELERIERLEQLRPLAAGIGIGVAVVPTAEGGIDTPADAVRAEIRLREPLPA